MHASAVPQYLWGCNFRIRKSTSATPLQLDSTGRDVGYSSLPQVPSPPFVHDNCHLTFCSPLSYFPNVTLCSCYRLQVVVFFFKYIFLKGLLCALQGRKKKHSQETVHILQHNLAWKSDEIYTGSSSFTFIKLTGQKVKHLKKHLGGKCFTRLELDNILRKLIWRLL